MRSNKNKKNIIIAVVTGGLAAFAVFGSLNSLNSKIEAQSGQILRQSKIIIDLKTNSGSNDDSSTATLKTYKYIVAADDIKSGTEIKKEMLDVGDFKVRSSQNYLNMNQLIGKTTIKEISEGDLIKKTDIYDENKNAKLIPKGMRNITIPVNYLQGISSEIKVGTKVDVLSISKGKDSQMILQNVEVYSLEDKTSKVKTTSAVDASGVTLQIPAMSSEKLVTAMQNGKLVLLTRNSNDENILNSGDDNYKNISDALPNVSVEDLKKFNIDNLPEPAAPATAEPAVVEIIQANVKTDMTFE